MKNNIERARQYAEQTQRRVLRSCGGQDRWKHGAASSSRHEDGAPLNAGSAVCLEGTLQVGYAKVRELRKLNGKRKVPRLSVRAEDR